MLDRVGGGEIETTVVILDAVARDVQEEQVVEASVSEELLGGEADRGGWLVYD